MWRIDNGMHRGLFIIKFHGKVRDSGFKTKKMDKVSRHAVTFPIVTHDVTGQADLGQYIITLRATNGRGEQIQCIIGVCII